MIDGPNLYAYVNNDPMNFVDPMGTQSASLSKSMQPRKSQGDGDISTPKSDFSSQISSSGQSASDCEIKKNIEFLSRESAVLDKWIVERKEMILDIQVNNIDPLLKIRDELQAEADKVYEELTSIGGAVIDRLKTAQEAAKRRPQDYLKLISATMTVREVKLFIEWQNKENDVVKVVEKITPYENQIRAHEYNINQYQELQKPINDKINELTAILLSRRKK